MDSKFAKLVKRDKYLRRERDVAAQRAPAHVIHPNLAATYDRLAIERIEGMVPKGCHRVSDFASTSIERETKGTFGHVALSKNREVMGKKVRVGKKGGYKVVPTRTNLTQRFFDKIADERAEKPRIREEVSGLVAEYLAKGGTITRV